MNQALFEKVKIVGRGYISNPDGTISVTDGKGGSLALTHDEYRNWCKERGQSCPLDEKPIVRFKV